MMKKKMVANTCTELFYQMIRSVIGTSDERLDNPLPEVWKGLYEMTQQQSLLGILFHGIEKNPEMRPPRELLLKWYAISEQIRRANEKTNEAAVELTDYFRAIGFRSCILKGQGNTLNYPDPYIRMSGDIDIWLEGGHDKIMKFVNSQWPGMLERYHHVEIPAWRGIPVEIHFTPSFMNAPWMNKRMQGWFMENAEEQFSHAVTLPDGAGAVCIPTNSFNIIYQLSHIYRHLFSEGIGLRQLVDYYYLLRKAKDDHGQQSTDYRELAATLKWLGMYKIATAVMWVLKEKLGLEDEYLIVSPNEKEGRFLLDEIMMGGNFGQYDTRLGSKEGEGIVHRYFRMSLRNMRYVQHYPSEALCEPFFRTWHFFWRLRHK